MFIIFGWRGVTSPVAYGIFHCPRCGSGSQYQHKDVHRCFTLFFVPLIPLDKLGEYVECQACLGTYRPEVLEYDPATEAAKWRAACHEAMLRVMVRMVAVDGQVGDEEIAVVCDIYERLTEQKIQGQEVATEAAVALGGTTSMAQELSAIAGSLNDRGKALVIQAAMCVAFADNRMAEEEAALLSEIGQALDMSKAHMQGVINEMSQQANQPKVETASLN